MTKIIVDTQQYTLRIPENLYKQVKHKMIDEKRNLRDILIDALDRYLEDNAE